MLTIGELASAAGTTTRTVRHHHCLGLLPEPPRRSNGSRDHDVHAVLRLVRIRRLEAAIRERRQRLLTLVSQDRDLTLSPMLAEILGEGRCLVPEPELVQKEGELLESTPVTEQFAGLTAQYRSALADTNPDPDLRQRSSALARRCEALADADTDDAAVTAVAAELVALGRAGCSVDDGPDAGGCPQRDRVWTACRTRLAPAQQRRLALVEREYRQITPTTEPTVR